VGLGDGFLAGGGVKFGEDGRDVVLDGAARHEEAVRDLGVGKALVERRPGDQPTTRVPNPAPTACAQPYRCRSSMDLCAGDQPEPSRPYLPIWAV
jgi:hypothetical protein